MGKIVTLKSIILFVITLAFSGFNAIATTHAHLSFSQMQVRATAPSIPNSAAYVKITNHGEMADRLIAAKSSMAKHIEIHSMEMDKGVMRMRPIDGGLLIPAGETVNLVPSGLHIMLMGLTRHLVVGSENDMILVFEKAGEVTLKAIAKSPHDIGATIAKNVMSEHSGHDMSENSQ